MRLFPSNKIVRCAAFTLLEVILAVSLATGILIAMLLFYRQAADLRSQLLLETDRLATIRLVLDRITADLRTARSDYESLEGLTGDASSLQFVRVELLPVSAWAKSEVARPVSGLTDLKMVAYSTRTALEGTNLIVSGLVRTERPLVPLRVLLNQSRKPALASENSTQPKQEPEPLTDLIRYLRFRYWDGTQWVQSWNDVELPYGVEVTLATESLPEEALPDDYSAELFRRVVYLPGHGAGSVTSSEFPEENKPPLEAMP